MATYPEGNPGLREIDPATSVGKLRALLSDTQYEEYDPAEPDFVNYKLFSDVELAVFAEQGGVSTTRGVGYAYLALASQAAMHSKMVKDYDLQVDLTKRAKDLRETAAMWFERADDEDDLYGTSDVFDMHPIGQGLDNVIPELDTPIYGRVYGLGRIR